MFIISGLIHFSYAITFFIVCFMGGFIGKSQVDGYVKKTGRASLLVLCLDIIFMLATMGLFTIFMTRLADKDWCFEGFKKFCDISDEEGCPVHRMLSLPQFFFPVH